MKDPRKMRLPDSVHWILLTALVLWAGSMSSPAGAKTVLVGPNQELKMPSAAVAVAKDGDTVQIEPRQGGYFDCAVWTANHLTIEGKGDGVIITDKSCMGKALFVIGGSDTVIRNLTFTRARVPDKNGAGIRQEGRNLRIENSHFINNENGILSAPSPNSTITILNSEFNGNGKCDPDCSHGVYIGDAALLHIENCVFTNTHVGHDVKSRALRTELIGNTITDGPTGTSSYLVDIPNGGSLIMKNNTLEKGENSENHSTAISIGEEGVTQPTEEIVISGNKFTNDLNVTTIFVRNGTATEAVLTGNTLSKKVTALAGDGSVH
jgi:hypothetical protein